MSTDIEEWFQPSLVIAIILASVAGATLYIEWAIDRKLSEHELEVSRSVADRFEQFRKLEREMEVQLAEIRVRLAQVESARRNGSNNSSRQENGKVRQGSGKNGYSRKPSEAK